MKWKKNLKKILLPICSSVYMIFLSSFLYPLYGRYWKSPSVLIVVPIPNKNMHRWLTIYKVTHFKSYKNIKLQSVRVTKLHNYPVTKFLSFQVSEFLNFQSSSFPSFQVFKFQSFKVSKFLSFSVLLFPSFKVSELSISQILDQWEF